MLTFDEATHSYYWNGVKVPGTTSILNDFVRVEIGGTRYHINRNTGAVIPTATMEEAGAMGTDIHAGCQIIANGGIDWSVLDGDYVGPLKQFEKWKEDHNPLILFTEAPFYSVRYNYAGTIDIIAQMPKALAFIDIKTGESASVGPQLAAYEKGWCEHNKYVGKTERFALWIPKNGDSYKFEKLENRERDWAYFQSCIVQHNFWKGGKQ